MQSLTLSPSSLVIFRAQSTSAAQCSLMLASGLSRHPLAIPSTA
ncbi:hypothetical protein JMJ77_0005762 [Colletotrichum scovillei]|uniref:Uncharacterized protein n=1 Tax=Colletotrichum scovillei TaxID=1209932 RepID=A0A9P7RKN4_9PEZI|nr:hypothetical protein JMJ77_0005762 [Colletotrichum scovillei]KAG7076965.1 hypothetical protein JMJ76_0014221 [Colletotrichum scovillei]KAG7084104.1 hypothetical protein JMJ78_0009544 [Colletotrichum scovillei]